MNVLPEGLLPTPATHALEGAAHTVSSIDSGDTAWLLCCVGLVLLMTPGLAFFYGGLVRANAAVNTIKMSFIALSVIAVEWAVCGYSLAFAPGGSWYGGLAHFGLDGVGIEPRDGQSVPHLVFMLFQMMFAIITPALISGAVVGRMRFHAYVGFIALWSLFVYVPLARWVWSADGWLMRLGALDFAGGTVVHVSAGVSALVAALVLGPRSELRNRGRGHGGAEERPHNVPFVVLGASLLWFGWFGFNAGSALAADGIAALAVVTTMLGAAAACLSWLAVDIVRRQKSTAVGTAIAAVIGLVAITPACGFVSPTAALVIGATASLVCRVTLAAIKRATRLDDTLDVFACHGVGGIVGALLTGVFASKAVNRAGADGLLAGEPRLLLVQLLGVLVAALLAAGGTVAAMWIVQLVVGLRPGIDDPSRGIDEVEHAEAAYAIAPRFEGRDVLAGIAVQPE